MRRILYISFALVGFSSSAFAQSVETQCARLYTERNAIYRQAGLCFTRDTAIAMFGTAGCRYNHAVDVPLSERQRDRIDDIVDLEAELGCRRR